MPVKRRAAKAARHRITPAAIEAFKANDFHALHSALGLAPCEASPLPREVTALGVHQGPCPYAKGTAWGDSWPKAQELQRQLLAAVDASADA